MITPVATNPPSTNAPNMPPHPNRLRGCGGAHGGLLLRPRLLARLLRPRLLAGLRAGLRCAQPAARPIRRRPAVRRAGPGGGPARLRAGRIAGRVGRSGRLHRRTLPHRRPDRSRRDSARRGAFPLGGSQAVGPSHTTSDRRRTGRDRCHARPARPAGHQLRPAAGGTVGPMRFGVAFANSGPLAEGPDRRGLRPSHRGGRVRLGLDGRARAGPVRVRVDLPLRPQRQDAGRRYGADARPAGLAGLRRGRHRDAPARHRDHHPPAAQPGHHRQGGGHARPAVGRSGPARHRRRLARGGVRRPRRPVRRAGQAHRRVRRRHAGAVDRRGRSTSTTATTAGTAPSACPPPSTARCRS